MFEITKRFTVPVGHRLSKHKGLCKNIHGHNIDIEISVRCDYLDINDMVIDFSDLKNIAKTLLDELDHVLLLNENGDTALYETLKQQGIEKIKLVPFEPTAERLAEYIYTYMNDVLPKHIEVSYVSIYENDTSKATYYT